MKYKFKTYFLAAEDLPTFPIEDEYLNAVKQRVNLAREIDKFQLNIRKSSSEEGWLKKAAEEMDIIVDDLYPLSIYFTNVYRNERGNDVSSLTLSQLNNLV